MSRIFNALHRNYKTLLTFYIILHILYFFLAPAQFRSDSFYYYQLSLESLKSCSIYPSKFNLYSDYLIAPLFINAGTVFLAIYDSILSIRFFQMVLNLLQFFLLYKITKKLFGVRVSVIFVLLYIFYFANLGMTLLNFTELFFGVLLSLTVWFLLKDKKIYVFLSGIAATASIAVRPTGLALLISIFIYFFFIDKKYRLRNLILFSIGALSFIIIFGTLTKLSSDHFVISSVNYGTNILIAANPDATGAYNNRVFEKRKIGYLEHPEQLTYIYKQRFWFNKAINWIANNPIEWIQIFPLKLVHIFVWDDYAISPLFMMQDWNLYVMVKHYFVKKNPIGIMTDVPILLQISYVSFQMLHHLYYYSIIFITLFVLLKNYKKIFKDKMIKLFLIIILLSLLPPLISFGDPRFKYPYILLCMIIISPYLNYYFTKNQKNNA